MIVVIVGDIFNVLCDICGKSVMLLISIENIFVIGWFISESGEYVEFVIWDVVFWEEEISEEKILKLYVCNGEFKYNSVLIFG